MLVFVLSVSIGFCLAGCGADRTVSFDPAFSEANRNERAENENDETGQEESIKKEQDIFVYVCGEVVTPGVYCLKEGSRVSDALSLAGGFTDLADTSYVNLAKKLTDAEKIYFPSKDETVEMEGEFSQESAGLVNINTADVSVLCTLPGIGEAKAADIVSFRESNGFFSSCEEIMKVPGIKTGAYNKIKDLITVK